MANNIESIWKLIAENGDAYDVVRLNGGRILAIGREGIELWPSFVEFVGADPAGDYAEMLGFIEWHYDPENDRVADLFEDEYRRFGASGIFPLALSYIRNLDHGFLLADGSSLALREHEIVLNGDRGRRLGEISTEPEQEEGR